MAGHTLDRSGLDDAAQTAKALYRSRAGNIKPKWSEFAMTIPSKGAQTNYNWLANHPKVEEWIGDRNVRQLKAYSYSIANRHWENSIKLQRTEIEDDGLGIVRPRAEGLADSVPMHQDELMFALLAAGWTTACFDGQNFYSATHPTATGTQDNDLGADELDSTGLRLAIQTMASFTDFYGNPLNILPDTLVVGPSRWGNAKDLLLADRNAAGATNTDKGCLSKLVMSPLITDTAWHVLYTGGAVRPFIFQERQKVREREWYNEENDEWRFGVDARYNVGYGMWPYAVRVTITT